MMMQKLVVKTSKNREIYDITSILNDLLLRNGFYEGMSFIFCMHTTCAISIVNLDGIGTDEDYINAYQAMIPKLNYKHPHDPGHFGDHLLSSTIGASLSIPVESGNLVLGLRQRVGFIEFSGPKERHITLSFLNNLGSSVL